MKILFIIILLSSSLFGQNIWEGLGYNAKEIAGTYYMKYGNAGSLETIDNGRGSLALVLKFVHENSGITEYYYIDRDQQGLCYGASMSVKISTPSARKTIGNKIHQLIIKSKYVYKGNTSKSKHYTKGKKEVYVYNTDEGLTVVAGYK